MASLKVKAFFVCSVLALSKAAPKASNPFIPIYNAISPLPTSLFSPESKRHSSYSPETIFHLPNYHKPHTHEPKSVPLVFDPTTPVYKPEPTPVYHPKLTYELNSPYDSKLFLDKEPSYTQEIVHEIKHKPKLFYKPKHSFKLASYNDDVPKPYAFDYGVQDQYSGANFGHSEASDGKEVKGSYTVALPDGRIQRVKYTADEYNGFQAEVTYEGEAKYPEYIPKPKPVYHPTPQYSKPEFHPEPGVHRKPKFHSEPEFHPEPDYTTPHHVSNSLPHPIPKPLQTHIPPYNPLPIPRVYSLPSLN